LWALSTVVAAQQDTIGNFTVPDGNLTLPYEFQSFGLDFDLLPGSDGRAIYDISWELMDGTQEEASNLVVDVVIINTVTTHTGYDFPPSLPKGEYHMRVNVTTNTTSPPSSVQNLSARSPTFTLLPTFQCKDPGPYPNISSPESSDFTSLVVGYPHAGIVFNVDDTDVAAYGDQFDFGYRDDRNVFGAGISSLTFEWLKVASDGSLSHIATYPTDGNGNGLHYSFSDGPFALGTMKFRVNYTNQIQDGPVKPGDLVSFLSQEIYVAGTTKSGNTCEGVPGKSAAGSSGAGSIRIGAIQVLIPLLFSFILTFFTK